MGKYAAKKILLSVFVLLGVTLLTFLLGRLAPGDPVDTVLAGTPNPTAADIDAARIYLGLDEPLAAQYVRWLGRVLTGDFGLSYRTGRPVTDELAGRFPATLQLALGSVLVMLAAAVPLGMTSALRRGRISDLLIRAYNVVAISAPSFCVAILLVLFFGVRLKMLPVTGSGGPEHLLMPSLALSLGAGAGLARLIRSQVLTHIRAEHVTAARVFGVRSGNLLVNHVLKNALPPVLTQAGLMIGGMLGGSAVIETLFSWPGMGSYAVQAIYARDYPVIQAYALIMAAVYILVNILIELGCGILQPKAARFGGTDAQ